MHLKMSSAKWRPFCLGLNVLNEWFALFYWTASRHFHYGARSQDALVDMLTIVVKFKRKKYKEEIAQIIYVNPSDSQSRLTSGHNARENCVVSRTNTHFRLLDFSVLFGQVHKIHNVPV